MSAVPGVVADCPLARRNPTVKLAVLLVVSLLVLVLIDPVRPLLLYLAALVGVAAGTRLAPRRLLKAQLPFAGFAVGLFLVNAVTRPGEVVAQLGVLRFTEPGIEVGAALAARTALVGILAVGFVVSTEPVALLTSLRTDARLPARVCYAVLAGYRMLHQLPMDWDLIRSAHAIRAPVGRRGRPRRGIRGVAQDVFALLVVAIRRGERIAATLESRGLGLEPRTTWRRTGIDGADLVLAAGVLGAVAATAGTALATR